MITGNVVLMTHGGGGRRTKELIEEFCAAGLSNPILSRMDDAAQLEMPGRHIVFTTDAFVVDPPFFPGGDIGRLSICGTVNDLAVQGGRPLYLSAAFILEEGFPLDDLRRIAGSMAAAAREAGILVVAGDTKVVERGRGGGIYITTSGVGARLPGVEVSVANARAGDMIIVSGPIGDHGLAVMGCREGLKFDSPLRSDAAPVWGAVERLLAAVPQVRCLRDPTRGGLAAALCDIAEASATGVVIDEELIPVRPEVVAACDILGLDPLVAACEGRFIAVCPPESVDRAMAALAGGPGAEQARVCGRVVGDPAGVVLLRTCAGGERVVDMPVGESLPRIC